MNRNHLYIVIPETSTLLHGRVILKIMVSFYLWIWENIDSSKIRHQLLKKFHAKKTTGIYDGSIFDLTEFL